jgi:1-acyl-sn-glycerol-3-phosphate acyltransferase
MPKYRHWIWWVAWAVYNLLRPLFCRVVVEGREHVPMTSGAVIACNHTYGPDYALMAFACPRDVCFMAKAEVFTWNPIVSSILRAGGVFPVQRGKGDTVAIDTAVQLAEEGNLIAMFPEGTRSKDGTLLRGKTGAARIALAAGVPIVPAAVINSEAVFKRKGWRRPVVTVRFAEPETWHANPAHNGEDDAEIARTYIDHVMGEIARMLPPEQRGEYAGAVDGEGVKEGVEVV